MSRVDEVRERLERRLSQLRTRAGKIQSDLRRPGDRDWEEQALERENEEVLERLDEAEIAEIDEIRAALARLDDGTWGVCGRCGERIPDERLAALPYTDTCVDCAADAESA